MYADSLTGSGEKKSRSTSQLPSLGRFLEVDPIGYEDDPNLYAYVRSDPINRTDPLGLNPLSRNNAVAAHALFGPGFNTGAVNLKFNNWLPQFFNRQAITTGNMININGSFISSNILFHELTHVWQYQNGTDQFELFLPQINDKFGADVYSYSIDADSSFFLYNTEAQAQILQVCIEKGSSKSPECRLLSDASHRFKGRGSVSPQLGLQQGGVSWGIIFYSIEDQQDGHVDSGDVINGPYYPPLPEQNLDQ